MKKTIAWLPENPAPTMARWGDDTTLKFVEQYRVHECLWNALNPHYKNNIKRNNAYLDLIANIDSTLTIKTVKAKIKNLRTVYHSEVKEIENSKRSGSGAEDVYYPSIPWFIEMDAFLKDMREYRETIESVSNKTSVLLITVTTCLFTTTSEHQLIDEYLYHMFLPWYRLCCFKKFCISVSYCYCFSRRVVTITCRW